MTRRIAHAAALMSVLLVGVWLARADAPSHAEQWSLKARVSWPPVLLPDRLVLRQGSGLQAHELATGKLLWKRKLSGLLTGQAALDGGDGRVYALDSQGLVVLDAADGKVLKRHKLRGAASVRYRAGYLIVATRGGLVRLDTEGDKVLSEVKGLSGTIEGVSGRHVLLTRLLPDPAAKGKARAARLKQLQVIDLEQGSSIYEFKLLPEGGHRVLAFDSTRVIFMDYTKRDKKGKNNKKIYYTEINYQQKKKIRDLSLSHKYVAPESDQVWATLDRGGILYVANHGAPGQASTLFAYDPATRRILWERAGEVATVGLLHFDQSLFAVTTGEKGKSQLWVTSPRDGATLFAVVLDAPGLGPLLAAHGRLVLGTKTSVRCYTEPGDLASAAAPPSGHGDGQGDDPVTTIAPPTSTGSDAGPTVATTQPAPPPEAQPAPPLASPDAGSAGGGHAGSTSGAPGGSDSAEPGIDDPGSATEPPPLIPEPTTPGLSRQVMVRRPGWHVYNDSIAGYRMPMPLSWTLDEAKVNRMGGVRGMTPYALTRTSGGKKLYLGTVQVLTWEASGRDAEGLWQSVLAQRKQLNPEVRLLQLRQVDAVGGPGTPGVIGSYSFNGPGNLTVELRSLCAVHHDVAFELRAWANPTDPESTWTAIEDIFAAFTPEQF